MVLVNMEGLQCTFYCITRLWSWRRCFINECTGSPECGLSVCCWAKSSLWMRGPLNPIPGLYMEVRPELDRRREGAQVSAMEVLFGSMHLWPVLGARLWWEKGVPDTCQVTV